MQLKLPKKALFFKTLKSIPVIIILSVTVLLVGTYGVWRYQSYYGSRGQGTLVSQGVTASVSTSDHTCRPNCTSSGKTFVPLVTNLDSNEQPDYTSTINEGPTPLRNMGIYFEMFRIQTRLSYFFSASDRSRSVPSTLSFTLPPKLIFKPDKLSIRGDRYHFVDAKTCFAKDGADVCATNLSIETVTTDDPNSTVDDRYVVSWTGIEPFNKKVGYIRETLHALGLGVAEAYNPPPATLLWFLMPKEIRLSFVSPQASIENVRTLRNYLSDDTTPAIVKEKVNFGSAACGTDSANLKRYLCYKTQVNLKVGNETVVPTQYLMQRMDYSTVPGGITVEGNVAALNNVSGFTISTPFAVVYGGAIASNVSGGEELVNYLSNSKLKWSDISPSLDKTINDGKLVATVASSTPTSTWYLNSPTKNPADSTTPTTFSSPPEGKLWLLNGNLTTAGAIDFSGSGTVIVNGNVTFNGPVTCSTGGRVGIIATGSITFTSNNIGCGTYLASGGSITFSSKASGRTTGIFVAKDNINLPKMNDGELFEIKYDTNFSSNPTVLFSEILKIINLTTNS